MKQLVQLFILVLFGTTSVFATHNRAGEITYRKLCDESVTTCLTYEIIVTTYTEASSLADRDEQTVYCGDGKTVQAFRINGPDTDLNGIPNGEIIGPDMKLNRYRAVHTFPGAGKYWMSMEDPNRNADIHNIPGSVNIPFYIHSLLIINPFLGNNNSPILLNPPIDNACIDKCYTHNPGAFDIDGDSLAYKLVACRGRDGIPIKGYSIPPTTNDIYLDEITGDFVWCAPPPNPGQGEYNIAILIEEYRGGYLIGSVLRDMQILVAACKNNPPVIEEIIDTCVQAGDTLRFFVTADDIDESISNNHFLFNTFVQQTFDSIQYNNDSIIVFLFDTLQNIDTTLYFVLRDSLHIYDTNYVNNITVQYIDSLVNSTFTIDTTYVIDPNNQDTTDVVTVLKITHTYTIKIKTSVKDRITLTAIGGALSPYVEVPPATFSEVQGRGPLSSEFVWPVTCEHVRKEPYLLSFKAKDNNLNIPLVDFESMQIRVVGPAPTNPTAAPSGTSMLLNWDASVCPDVIGYKIYRHNGFTGWVHGACETGVPAYTGYEYIGKTDGLNTTNFTDNNNGAGLIHGLDYCYMVVACFPEGVEGYASVEFCARLIRDVPVITNVDVTNTAFANGMIDIKWVKPIADSNNLDTLQNPGPYEFRLLRSPGFNGVNPFTEIHSFSSPYFASLDDTLYTDTLLNTSDLPYTYRIDFYTNSTFKGSTQTASSVYLSIAPSDNKNILSWEEHVPWENYQYVVYKKAASSIYQVLDTVVNSTYTDTGLVNGVEYCYLVKSIGAYSDTTIIHPLYNSSEKKCEAPIDNIPPCQPYLEIVPNCDITENALTWTNPNNICSDDVVQYNIYYTAVQGDDFILLGSTYHATDTVFMHDSVASIAGCYAVTALDTFFNESPYSNIACIDNCPVYELPNIFTPDGDGINDVFKPFPYKYVQDIHIKIWNRWGEEVFETTNPYIGWDGRHKESKRLCADGVYFYVCEVNEIRLNGIEKRILKGYLQILTSK